MLDRSAKNGSLSSPATMSPDKTTLDDLRIDRSAATPRRANGRVMLVFFSLLLVAAGVIWWINRPKPVAVRTMAVQESSAGQQQTLLNAAGYVTARRVSTVSS